MLRSPESEIEIIKKRCFNAGSSSYAARFVVLHAGRRH
jgi:hypothetical protein